MDDRHVLDNLQLTGQWLCRFPRGQLQLQPSGLRIVTISDVRPWPVGLGLMYLLSLLTSHGYDRFQLLSRLALWYFSVSTKTGGYV